MASRDFSSLLPSGLWRRLVLHVSPARCLALSKVDRATARKPAAASSPLCHGRNTSQHCRDFTVKAMSSRKGTSQDCGCRGRGHAAPSWRLASHISTSQNSYATVKWWEIFKELWPSEPTDLRKQFTPCNVTAEYKKLYVGDCHLRKTKLYCVGNHRGREATPHFIGNPLPTPLQLHAQLPIELSSACLLALTSSALLRLWTL